MTTWINYEIERMSTMIRDFTIFKFVDGLSFAIEFLIVYFLSEDGKFSINNKVFTGFMPAGWNSMILIV